MITDIPSSQDFQSVGLQLLNSAWETAASLLADMHDAAYHIDPEEEGSTDAYWRAAVIQLNTALSVAQQGCEFLLKGRIAEVSPYLLISSSPRDWPSGAATNDVPFSDFRTVDAQDLVKMHDTYRSNRLSKPFIVEFHELRGKRNTITHSINKNLVVEIEEILLAVLGIFSEFFPSDKWVDCRRKHLSQAPLAQLYSDDFTDYRMILEFSKICEMLKPAQLLRHFGFDKKQRTYICPNCSYGLVPDAEIESKTALLAPNKPTSEEIYCFVCDESQWVTRKDCAESACMGNVISEDYGYCLTCGGRT